MSTRFLLKNVRLAFGQGLWIKTKPPKTPPETKEKFRCQFLLTRVHPQLVALRKVIDTEGEALFGTKWKVVKAAAEAQGKICLRDGDLKAEYDGFEGNWSVSANSFTRPTVFGPDGEPASEDSGIVYSGCYVDAIIGVKAYNNVSKGITAELAGVRFFADGNAFSGGRPADADEFGDSIAAPAAEDELAQ